jgi:hypothetical protein
VYQIIFGESRILTALLGAPGLAFETWERSTV